MNTIHTHILGYPRIGGHRELKKATELYWSGRISREQLQQTGKDLREQHWKKQAAAGVKTLDEAMVETTRSQASALGYKFEK